MTTLTGGELVLRCLAREGVKHAIGITDERIPDRWSSLAYLPPTDTSAFCAQHSNMASSSADSTIPNTYRARSGE